MNAQNDKNYERFRDELFGLAAKEKLEAAELYYVKGESFRASVLKAELDSYHVSNSSGVSLRVKARGKTGYAYSETFEDADILFRKAWENALCIENEDEQPMTPGGLSYAEVHGYSERIGELSEKEKIELALALEQKALKADERVARVQSCALATGVGETRIENTLGLSVSYKSSSAIAYVTPVVIAGGETRDGFSFRLGKHVGELDFDKLALEAVAEALAQLGAQSYPSGRSGAVLRADVAASMLSAFSPVFSAEDAQKGLSLLKDKEGERIAASHLSIIDDPLMAGGYASAPFDAEGTPAMPLHIIENGTLRSLLHNLKTARKAATRTTGHAGKASAASPVDISPTNLHIEPGTGGNMADLLKTMDTGLLITDVSGLHAGVNTVSGDFSLLARGFEIVGGKRARPVDQVTIAGNFYELLKGIRVVGGDLFFQLPGGKGCAGSPSLLIDGLTVAGS